MRRSIFMTALAVAALTSCNRVDMLDVKDNTLNISVRNAIETKSVIESTTLPTGSEIGVFVTDDNGIAYLGNTIANVKYTATGEGDSQVWNTTSDIMLSTTKATLRSYYPYDESIVDITAIPIEVTSEVQKDWMWGAPVTNLDHTNNTAVITMKHALAAVKFNFVKGNYTGEGKVTSVAFTSTGALSQAVLNAKNGSLTNKKCEKVTFVSNKEFTLLDVESSVSFIAVPLGEAATLTISAVIDGKEMRVNTANVTLESGKICECDLSINTPSLTINKLNVTEWTVEQMGEVELQPYSPTVNFSMPTNKNYIRAEYNYNSENKSLIFKIIPLKEGYVASEATVSGGKSTQSIDENGVRTIIITDIVSSITVKLTDSTYGATYVPWARIQHVNGTLYTAEEWLAAETAGEVTDTDANGVAVRYSETASCPHVIYPHIPSEEYKWANSSGSVMNTYNNTSDVNGKANTEAILAAVANGTLSNAPAAQYCASVTFANGQNGYLPAIGEITAWRSNKDMILSCLEAIGVSSIFDTNQIISSTQIDGLNDRIYGYDFGQSKTFNASKTSPYKVVAVTSLEL